MRLDIRHWTLDIPQRGFIPIWLVFVIVATLAATSVASLPKKSRPMLTPQSSAAGQAPTPTPTVSPSPSPEFDTSNWQTYRNEEYGFEVKYPAGWEIGTGSVTSYPQNNNRTLAIKFFEPLYLIESQFPGPQGEFLFEVYRNTQVLSLNAWIDAFQLRNPSGGTLLRENTAFSLSGINARKLLFFSFDSTWNSILVSTNDYVFSLSYYDYAGNDPSADFHRDIYDQILSTFKFIEPDATANWKTYRNEQYGFEVQLPVGWLVEKERDELHFLSPRAQEGKKLYEQEKKKLYAGEKSEFVGDCCPPYYDFVFTTATSYPKDIITKDPITNNEEVIISNFGVRFLFYGIVGSMWGGTYYATEKEGLVYNFELINVKEDVIRQILSTFKFLP